MKEISLIKKANELGLCKISKHPITGHRVICPPDMELAEFDLTSEWEELQAYANNRRNVKVKLKLNVPKRDVISKPGVND